MVMKRVRLIVYGNVQGVFYRANTRNKASQLGLKGFVKNLPDGTVEVVAEGPEGKLNALIEFCRNSPGYSNVSKVDVKEEKATGEFERFEVRY
jgi:acylphosphatase